MKNGLNRALALLMFVMLMISCTVYANAEQEQEAGVVVFFEDGSRLLLPADIAGNPQALKEYCQTYMPGRNYALAPVKYDAKISSKWASAHYGEDTPAVGVGIVTLSVSGSVVTLAGENVTVPTSELIFADGVDAAKHVAVVHAPRSGEATLRAKASGTAEKIAAAKTGRIVAVLEYTGSTYTKILYDGEEGYIRTDCLIFHNGRESAIGSAVLTGKDSVALYSTESSSTAKVGTWDQGTSVIVYERKSGWCTVEIDGWYGYVQDKYADMVTE